MRRPSKDIKLSWFNERKKSRLLYIYIYIYIYTFLVHTRNVTSFLGLEIKIKHGSEIAW